MVMDSAFAEEVMMLASEWMYSLLGRVRNLLSGAL
jgi:hypothetical protein